MVCQWNGGAIVVNCLFVYVNLQTGKDEDGWGMGILDIFHSRLTFHRCQYFIHDVFFRVCESQYKNFSYVNLTYTIFIV